MSIKISAFVVSYNRENIIGTCLKALQFADEIILVDKSSSDSTVEIATPLVDLIKIVPWSPTVEDTRAYAESLCTHDWILFLDDDECLNVEAIKFIKSELQSPRALIYSFPLKHYICGIHSEDAYYWPEHHIRLYKKGSIKFGNSVHGSIQPQVEDIYAIPVESGVFIHHFSHKDVAEWIEKANRYTSQLKRERMLDPGAGSSIINYAHRAIDRWANKRPLSNEAGYEAMVSVLRALYDIIDRLKCWGEFKHADQDIFKGYCIALENSIAEYSQESDNFLSTRSNLVSSEITDKKNKVDKWADYNNSSDQEGDASFGPPFTVSKEEHEKAIQKIIELDEMNLGLQDQVKQLLEKLQNLTDSYEYDLGRLSNYCKDLEESNANEITYNRDLQMAYQNSLSWKMTSPIRWMGRLVNKYMRGQ